MKNRKFLLVTGTFIALVGGITEAGCSKSAETTPAANPTGGGGSTASASASHSGATSSASHSASASAGATTSSGAGTGGGGAGATGSGGTGTTASTGATGGGGTGAGTGGAGGGPTTSDCATTAMATCTQEQKCRPNIFVSTYKDMATCVDVLTTICSTAKPAAGSVVNPAKCLADRTASCTAYLSVNQPASCAVKYKAGPVADMVSCDSVSNRCVAGEYCYFGGDPATCSYCVQTPKVGDICDDPTNVYTSTADIIGCDAELGQTCTKIFDATSPTGYKQSGTPLMDDAPTCQAVTYGAAGADCFAGSTKLCDSGLGLYCGPSKKCVPLLGLNADCSGASSKLCDTSQGLDCVQQTAADGVTITNTCLPSIVVPVGATCGMVLGADGKTMEQHNCAAFQAICSTDGTTKCIALVKKGEVCVNTPNNCDSFTADGVLVCTAGTCQVPPPPAACTPNANLAP